MSDRLFEDRAHAGRALAAALEPWRGTDAVVCGVPRGGVVVAAEVARALGLWLEVVVVRKLGSTSNEELAVGAIAAGVRIVEDDSLRRAGMRAEQLETVEQHARAELERREALFGGWSRSLRGLTAIVADDGVATGSTALAACRSVRAREAASVVLATPVAPVRWSPGADADEYVCLHAPPEFWAVGQFYSDFRQTTDAEVLAALRRS
ncbi:MAG: phosphoribosyltransferase family protein [Microbacterium sp.]|uniref:phosphoribosyltransferase n=1 Tax=Microbacterium sp. TaxID=51671 RepID=UPI0039E26358